MGGNTRVNGISSLLMDVYRRIDRQRFHFDFYNSSNARGFHEDEILRLGGAVHYAYSHSRGVARLAHQMWRLSEILSKHGPYDAVHCHYYSANGFYLLVAMLHGVPVRVSHCQQAGPAGMSQRKRAVVGFSRTLVRFCATNKLGCCQSASRFLHDGGDAETLFNAIDYRRFNPAAHSAPDAAAFFDLDPRQRHIVFVGRLEPQKNVAFLVESYSRFLRARGDVRLVIVGTGTLRESLMAQATAAGLRDSVSFIDRADDTAQLLSVADLLVLPSLWEGLPLVLLEAQAMGVPCLVSDRVTNDVNLGLCTYLPLDPRAWTSATMVVLEAAAPKTARTDTRFDVEHVTTRLAEIYSGEGHISDAIPC